MIRYRLLGVIWWLWLAVGALAGREGNVVRTRSRRQLLSGMFFSSSRSSHLLYILSSLPNH